MGAITYKQYVVTVLLVMGIVLSLSGVTNYLVDPAKIYSREGYEHGIVDFLHQGMNVANISNYDERLFQKYYVESLTEYKDVLVLGSSRSLQVRAELFEPYSFFNASVSGGSTEDYLAILAIYYQHGFVPGKVVLGVDPWVFNSNNNQSRWKAIREYYHEMKRLIGVGSNKDNTVGFIQTNKVKQLIAWGYLKESVLFMMKGGVSTSARGREYYPIANDIAPVSVKRSDGSLYEAVYEARSVKEVEESAMDFMISPYSLDKFRDLDRGASVEFEKLIEFMLKNNIEVSLFLPPYHPHVYEHLINKGKLPAVAKVEDYLVAVSKKYNISLIGSYNPAVGHCDESEFYDGMHPKESCVNRIFRSSM